MKLNFTTYLLIGAVVFLLVSTFALSFLLRSDSTSSPTTIKKTKAAAQTYTQTIQLGTGITPLIQTSPTPVGAKKTGTPTPVILSQKTNTPTPIVVTAGMSPTPRISSSITPTMKYSSSITPTKINTSTAVTSPTVVVTRITSPPVQTTLPKTGWTDFLLPVIGTGIGIIVLSFLF
ncbi:hypothetical protein HGA88_03015 [Candidatus Roizmanbacteria bacterium]|nr:hypothetical protein [Candidatus Roizmanbacteria bacterium]